MRLDGVEIGVTDLASASAAYSLLLGVAPIVRAGVPRFALGRGAVELVAGADRVQAIRFVLDPGERAPVATFHGLDVRFDPADAVPDLVVVDGPVDAIDHVVVQTPDAGRAIALWRDDLGLRLALDRAFDVRGLRLVFFRSGGITLEYASPHPAPAERDVPDRLHGVSYRVRDLAAHCAHLAAAGLDVSPVRPGMRPGTSVATVRSGTAGVPTLLLEVHAEARQA